MRRFIAALLCSASLSLPLNGQGSAITTDITYVAGAEGLGAAVDPAIATIVDLRHRAPDTFAATSAIEEPGTLRIILLSGEHATDWSHALATRAADVLIIGPAEADAPLDLTVNMPDDAITTALRAMAEGTLPATLALPAITKRRFDESALVQRHHGDTIDADDSGDTAGKTDAVPAKPVVTDAMLERAVQIIQGLRALKRG
jgi:hypothetical protein